jgi:hypothetical protein
MENLLVPSSAAEPNILIKMGGRNELDCVEVDGWTLSRAISFPGLRSDLGSYNYELLTL